MTDGMDDRMAHTDGLDAVDQERQDAILPRDYKLTVWSDGKLLPIAQTPYGKTGGKTDGKTN